MAFITERDGIIAVFKAPRGRPACARHRSILANSCNPRAGVLNGA
jgi:hypothetical protein